MSDLMSAQNVHDHVQRDRDYLKNHEFFVNNGWRSVDEVDASGPASPVNFRYQDSASPRADQQCLAQFLPNASVEVRRA